MTCLGVALLEPEGGTIVATHKFYFPQPEGKIWEERCLNEFWKKPENKELYETTLENVKNAPPINKSMAAFKQWVLDVTKGKKVCIVFDTAGFDQSWVDLYLQDTSCLYLLGYYQQTRDITSYKLGFTSSLLVGMSGTMRFNVQFPDMKIPDKAPNGAAHDHDPEHDAACIAGEAAHVLGVACFAETWNTSLTRSLKRQHVDET
jgi:hypothetical protein